MRAFRRPAAAGIGIIPILILALGLGGCALNSSGLPGGLPVPPGGGTLSITRTTLVNGIQGRTYTIWIPTTGGSGTLSTCSIIAGSLPAGLNIAISADPPTTTAVSFCKITGTITTVGPATVSFTVQAVDTAANTTSQSLSIFVRPDFAVTTATPFLNGVIGRTYGNAPQAPQPVVTSVSATVGNAPLATCVFTIAGNPGFNLTPAATGGNTCPLSSGATVLTASGPFTVNLAATDSPIMDTFAGQTTKVVVPAATKNSAALALTVNAALGVTLTQATNATPTTALLDAVQGRSYGVIGGTPTYTATGGLTTTGNYNWCISVSPLPAGFVTGPVAVSTNCAAPTAIATATSVTVTSPAAGAAGGPTAFTLLAGDTGNAAVPALTTAATVGLVSNTAATNLTINGLLGLAANLADPLPDAVIARTYGGAGFTSIIYTASGGAGAYTFTAPPTAAAPAAGVFPTPMSCVPAATTLTCSSAAITGTPGAYTNAPTMVDDAGNTAVPGSVASAATITVTRSLTVLPALTFLSVNYANPLPDAVNGRSWGTGVGFTPLVYTAQNGLGGYVFTLSGTAFPTGIACVTAGATFTCDTTAAGTVTGAAAAYNGIIVNVNDTANATTPSASASATQPAAVSRDITVNAQLTVTLQVGSPDPTTPAGQAVVGRTYGAPAKTDVVYLVSGGLPPYLITASGTLTTTTNILCVSVATTSTCSSLNLAVTNTGGINPSLTISATDTANSATPSGAASKTDIWTVNAVISFTLAPAPTIGVPPTTGVIPDGVIGLTYGTPLADLVFTATGGLANAAGFGLTGTQTGTLAANGIVCLPTTAQVGVTVTVTCNSGGLPVIGPAGPGTLIMTFSDVGNSTTPAGSTNTDTAGFTDYSNTIASALAIALQAGSPDPANVNAQAVVGRTYGMAPQAPVVYEATNGLPAYTFVRSGTLLANSNICAVQNVTATTLTCDSNGLAVTGTTGVLTVTVNSTGNATTPSSSASLTKTYTVNPAVSLSVTPDPALASSTAVVGRLYGAPAGGGLLSPTYTAAGGLSLYTFIHSGTLEANTNIICTDAATTVTCESAVPVTGTAPFPEVEPFTLQVTDGSNLTTPADLVGATLTKNFTINDVLAITTTSVPNGLVNFTYVPTGPGVTLLATGGLGGNTWVAGGPVGSCAPTGSLPTGLSLGAATGLLSGIPTVISTLTTDFTFDVCVFDTANVTTPSGNDTHVNYVINVIDTLAAAAAPGTDTVEVFNTTSNTFFASVALNPGDIPTGVAVTPDGRKLYVTLNGADDVAIIDTITGAVTTVGGLGTCTGPQGIAIGLPPLGVPTAFVACSNGEVAVIDASTDTFVSSGGFGNGGAFYGVAMNAPTDTLVYVTDSSNNEFVVLDALTVTEIAGSPFAAGVTAPHGVAISNDGARVYLAGSGSDNVIAISTADNTTVVSTGAAAISTGAGSSPESIAVTPSGTHVFVTLTGLDQFAVFNDSATPALNTTVALTAASSPWGVTIPPLLTVPATGVRVYIGQFSLDNVAIRDDETVTPFGANAASPIALTAGSTPSGMTHIPVPR